MYETQDLRLLSWRNVGRSCIKCLPFWDSHLSYWDTKGKSL